MTIATKAQYESILLNLSISQNGAPIPPPSAPIYTLDPNTGLPILVPIADEGAIAPMATFKAFHTSAGLNLVSDDPAIQAAIDAAIASS